MSSERVRVTLPGPPNPSDPLASNYRSGRLPLDPTDVVGELIESRPDGTARVLVGDRGRGGGVLDVVEGTGADTYGRLGALSHVELRALRDAAAALQSEPNPALQLAARTALAMFKPSGRRRTGFDLLAAATDTRLPADLRALAMVMAALIAVVEGATLEDGADG